MRSKISVLLFVLIFALMAQASWGHDGAWTWSFDSWNDKVEIHQDDDPWKGFATVTVYNSSNNPWGNFHFKIVNGPGVTIESDPAPSMTWPGYSWEIVPGAEYELHYNFSNSKYAGIPVMPGQSVTFIFYTDNTANKNAFFGVCGYPTPVPEPASILILSSGLIGLAGFARRRK